MGKSSKKIKSDRINALRKQYDAFLENDKKRKERNEYILGKLDKMVYSNALVPTRTKSMSLVSRPSAMYHLTYQVPVAAIPPSGVIKQRLNQDIQEPNIDDTHLIQEIRKKYILIPKLTSPFINNYLEQTQRDCNGDIIQDLNGKQQSSNMQQPSSNDNTDWKSKYEILNLLKKEETETPSVKCALKRANDNLSNNSNEKDFAAGDNVITEDMNYNTDYKDLNESPEKDVSDQKIHGKLEIDNDTNSPIMKPYPMTHVSTDNNIDDAVANISHELQKTRLMDCDHTKTNATNQLVDETNYVKYEDDYNNIEPIDPTLIGEQIRYEEHPSDRDINADQAEYNYHEPILSIPAVDQVHYAEHVEPVLDKNTMLEENLGGQDFVQSKPEIDTLGEQCKPRNVEKELYIKEYDNESVEVISSTDLIKEINNPTDNDTKNYVDYEPVLTSADELTSNVDFKMDSSHDEISEQTGNVIPEPKEEEEAAVDIVGIQDFNAEQREMFYSEHPAEGYEYQQDYGTMNNTEYHHQNENFQQNESYQQNINYYDGSLQQQVYPVDVDEDEEHLKLKYDQSYHQQYVDPYEKAYNNQQPEFQNPDSYEPIQPEQLEGIYDEQSYENADQIQEAMDKEEGFNESTPEGEIAQAQATKSPDAK